MKPLTFATLPIGTVSAVFFSKKDANRTYSYLLRHGHSAEDIAMLMSDETLNQYQQPSKEEIQPVETESKPVVRNLLAAYMPALRSWLGKIFPAFQKTLAIDPPNDFLQQTKEAAFSNASLNENPARPIMQQEGGIIISVDPKSERDLRDIVNIFRINNGRDILGDDGYSSL